ncbi:putative hydrolases of HD superfamily [Paucidesulfovibrio gracilis DSM 16080]|uniref:Putative hydrolases of HD superfamily n=1 Tax=Paucidesulfovibrio gracilis DSM 16080 TaxID=1121449 RepID=A0A1T4W6I7_9BACT|nr:HD domain-containing protein [Paucidesulfovibrio gracilis]SKA72331.1 putative hydrolases of HD superfamily [Paucidesulfovibrio gracilis DSM 16080]
MQRPMIRKGLLDLVFSGAYMKRWNDKLRPLQLVEVDKQSHKMIVAWLLFMLNSRDMDEGTRLNLGDQVVEGGMFDYLFRLVITDIKPPVFYRIKANPDDYARLSDWVLKTLRPLLAPLGEEFLCRMTDWLRVPEEDTQARRILSAAHLYASYSEFKLIKGLNPFGYDMDEIERSFLDRLDALSGVAGVPELLAGLADESQAGAMARLAALCGHLRFQQRWSQTPRVPETTVLGHVFLVAAYAWFFSLEVGACRARRQNNFFTGLFHDLPELLTRDIISPVKQSAPEIADLIRAYEEKELEQMVLEPLRGGGYTDIAARLEYYLGKEVGSEFTACVVRGGKVQRVESVELARRFNKDGFDPKDGELLKMCDSIAAFIEAYAAIRNGISADQLHQAVWRLRSRFQETPEVAGVQVGALMADFD